MVEINKRSFMDVKTFKKDEGFDMVQNAARAVLRAVTQRARERVDAGHEGRGLRAKPAMTTHFS